MNIRKTIAAVLIAFAFAAPAAAHADSRGVGAEPETNIGVRDSGAPAEDASGVRTPDYSTPSPRPDTPAHPGKLADNATDAEKAAHAAAVAAYEAGQRALANWRGSELAREASERAQRCGNVFAGDLPVRGSCK